MRNENRAAEYGWAFPPPKVPIVPEVPLQNSATQPLTRTKTLTRTKSVYKIFLIAEAGLEPARDYLPQDFKS